MIIDSHLHLDDRIEGPPNFAVEELSKQLKRNDIIIPDDGGHLTWFMQAFKTSNNDRNYLKLE